MKLKINILAIFLLMSFWVSGQSIPVTESEVRNELESRGISEQELINEMNARGIQVQDLENLTPSQLAEIEQIVIELEARNAERESSVIDSASVDKEEFLEVPTTKETEQLKEEIKQVIEDEMVEEEPEAKIYGHAFFKNRDLSVFETSTEVKAPDNYILGAGDKVVISIFGISRAELAHEIDSDGYIEVNNRKIFLKGLSLEDARTKLYETLSRFYRFNRGEFEVSLSYSRTINVNIQGEVVSPGGYTLSAVNNAFNGLIAAGGPTDIGSLRDILLIKTSGTIVNLDFYSYLRNPQDVSNASLEEGDVLIIPVAKKIVNIKGGVRRPMRYELKASEDLSDVIDLAGGYTSNANRSIVQITRTATQGKTYIDVRANAISNFELQDGDVINIRKIENVVENYVSLKGAVINQGEYERTEGLTLGEAISNAELQPGARRDIAFIKRVGEDESIIYIRVNIEQGNPDLGIPLRNRDEIRIFDSALFNENQQFEVDGAVREPGLFSLAIGQEIPVKNAIELAGGLRRDAAPIAIIHTKDPLNTNIKQYRRIDLRTLEEDNNEVKLTALDRLEIFSQSYFDESSEVSVYGAVNNPGSYQYGNGMTLADVFTMSGGFRLGAATNRVEISRLVIEDNEPTKVVVANLAIDRDLTQGSENLDFLLLPYDEIMVRFVPEFELQQIVKIEGEVQYPGTYSLIKENETVRELLLRAGGLTDEAFPTGAKLIRNADDLGAVVIKLDEVMNSRDSRFNFQLRGGDELIIPKTNEFVTILGATNAGEFYTEEFLSNDNRLNVPFHSGKNAKFYIETYAGGIADYGSSKKIYVEDANGEITRTRNFLLYRDYPEVEMGSKIIVGRKPVKTEEQKEKEEVDWSKVLADSVGQAVSILSLLLLIQRI